MSQPEQQLTLIEEPNVSIDELIQLQADGCSVLRSAHIGNLSPYNLVLAKAGVRMLLVDHNITGIDKNYFPESVANASGNERLAEDGLLSSRAEVEPSKAGKPTYLDEFHVSAISQAFPDAQLFTNTDYVRKHESVAGEILAIAAAGMPELFTRIVAADGSTRQVADGAERLAAKGALQLADDPRTVVGAVLIPNEVNIVLNFVIEALESAQATQYHLSGPAMMQYVLQSKRPALPRLRALYAEVSAKASFGKQLPADLQVKLVPTTEARFATTSQRQPQLDQLLEAAQAGERGKQALAAVRAEFFTGENSTDTDAKQAMDSLQQTKRARLVSAIDQAAQAIPEQFTPPRSLGFISQYDVSNEGGLYVPAINRTASMTALRGLTTLIDNAIRQRRL